MSSSFPPMVCQIATDTVFYKLNRSKDFFSLVFAFSFVFFFFVVFLCVCVCVLFFVAFLDG